MLCCLAPRGRGSPTRGRAAGRARPAADAAPFELFAPVDVIGVEGVAPLAWVAADVEPFALVAPASASALLVRTVTATGRPHLAAPVGVAPLLMRAPAAA